VTHLSDFLLMHRSLWSMVKMVSMKSSITLGAWSSPSGHPQWRLKQRPRGEVSVLMFFVLFYSLSLVWIWTHLVCGLRIFPSYKCFGPASRLAVFPVHVIMSNEPRAIPLPSL
jgi:hypothetical protein